MFIYSVPNVWFCFAIYKNAVLFSYCTVLALSAAATIANIKIRYDAKIPQFAIFGTRVICVFYNICCNIKMKTVEMLTPNVYQTSQAKCCFAMNRCSSFQLIVRPLVIIIIIIRKVIVIIL